MVRAGELVVINVIIGIIVYIMSKSSFAAVFIFVIGLISIVFSAIMASEADYE